MIRIAVQDTDTGLITEAEYPNEDFVALIIPADDWKVVKRRIGKNRSTFKLRRIG